MTLEEAEREKPVTNTFIFLGENGETIIAYVEAESDSISVVTPVLGELCVFAFSAALRWLGQAQQALSSGEKR